MEGNTAVTSALRKLTASVDALESQTKSLNAHRDSSTALLAGVGKTVPEPFELIGDVAVGGLLQAIAALEARILALENGFLVPPTPSQNDLDLTIDRLLSTRLQQLGLQPPPIAINGLATPTLDNPPPEEEQAPTPKRKRTKPVMSNSLKEVARRSLKELLAKPDRPTNDSPYCDGPAEPIIDSEGRRRHRPDLKLTYKQMAQTPEGTAYLEDVRAYTEQLRLRGKENLTEADWLSIGDAIETSYDGVHRAYKLAKEGTAAQDTLRTKKRRDGRRTNRSAARKEALDRLRARAQYLDAKYDLGVEKICVSEDETDNDDQGLPLLPKSTTSRPPTWRSEEMATFIADLEANIYELEQSKIRKAGANQPVVRSVGATTTCNLPKSIPIWTVDAEQLNILLPSMLDRDALKMRGNDGKVVEKWQEVEVDMPGMKLD